MKAKFSQQWQIWRSIFSCVLRESETSIECGLTDDAVNFLGWFGAFNEQISTLLLHSVATLNSTLPISIKSAHKTLIKPSKFPEICFLRNTTHSNHWLSRSDDISRLANMRTLIKTPTQIHTKLTQHENIKIRKSFQ